MASANAEIKVIASADAKALARQIKRLILVLEATNPHVQWDPLQERYVPSQTAQSTQAGPAEDQAHIIASQLAATGGKG